MPKGRKRFYMKSIAQTIISWWEKFFAWKENIHHIDGSKYRLLRFNIHPYNCKETLELPDGNQIKPGDYVAELHISNLVISKDQIGDITITSELQLLPMFREEMKLLGHLASQGKIDPRVKAIWGITLFSPGVRRLGFSIKPLDNNFKAWRLKTWMGFLGWVFSVPVYHPHGKSKTKRNPCEFFMSMDELIKKYGY